MKKILLSAILFSVFANSNVFAQDEDDDYKRKAASIGFSGNLWEYNTSPKFDNLGVGMSLYFWKGITNNLDYSLRFNAGITDYLQNDIYNSNFFLVPELEGSLHLKAFSDEKRVNPFLTGGVGLAGYKKSYNERTVVPYVPLGVGIQFFVVREAYIFTQANYRLAFSDHLDNHLFYSLGVAQRIGKSTPRPTPPPAAPVVVAPVDSDGDGIPDNVDKCPNQKGVAKYDGCPIPDTDGDGINDEEDKCPNEKGVARYNGCPIPDSDGDGVNDEEDKCPNVPGPASNRGCPEVKAEVKQRLEVVAKAIQFETGKAILTKKSANTLDEIVSMMNEYPDYNLHIDGHTDNTGNADKNQTLSENRAAAVKQYLVGKGIDASRMHSNGWGINKPIADNKTAAGRAINRRVELELKLKD